MVTSVFRRANTMYVVENGGSSGESSRRPSAVDAPRRPSLAALSLRLSSRSKRSTSVKDSGAESESAWVLPEDIYPPHADILVIGKSYGKLSSHFPTRSLLRFCAISLSQTSSLFGCHLALSIPTFSTMRVLLPDRYCFRMLTSTQPTMRVERTTRGRSISTTTSTPYILCRGHVHHSNTFYEC